MTTLVIIRHCETEGNVRGEMQGYYNDSAFTEKGKDQAELLLKKLGTEKINAVYCSDLGRAIKTAQVISQAHNLKLIALKELREGNIGDWRTLPVKEGIQKWIEYYEAEKKKGVHREDIRPPNGENSFDHQRRIMTAIKKIVKQYPKGIVVIVGHSGTNRVIIGTLEGKDPDDFYKISQDNACINIVKTDGVTSKVILVNDTTHLQK